MIFNRTWTYIRIKNNDNHAVSHGQKSTVNEIANLSFFSVPFCVCVHVWEGTCMDELLYTKIGSNPLVIVE